MFMKAKRIGEIEILRFLFCLLIVVYHCNTRIVGHLEGYDYQFLCGPRGYIGVEFFFMLSGFFMAGSTQRMNADAPNRAATYLRFLWKKYVAVFPYHIIAFVLLFVRLCIDLKGFSLNLLLKSLPNFFLIQRSGIKYFDINSVEWYISAMLMAMAVILPFAVKYKDTYAKYIAPVTALIIYGFILHKSGAMGNIHAWTSYGFKCFWRALAGINLGFFASACVEVLRRYKFSKKERSFAIAIRLILWVLVFVFAFLLYPQRFDFVFVVMMFVALVLTFVFGFESEKLNGKVATYLGRMSLTMYLNQIFVIKIVNDFCQGWQPVVIVLVVIAANFALSALTLWLGDKMLHGILNGRFNRIIMGIDENKA